VDAVKNARTLSAHLAACGITVDEVESYVYFALYYCLDAVRLPYFTSRTRQKYALTFISAQHRSLFYPFPPMPPSEHSLPSWWKFDHIKEYRRQQAVVQRWIGAKPPKINPQYELSTIPLNPPAPDVVMSGIANMGIDNTSSGPGPQVDGSS
ncbi:hypothetical protein L218DRAFT_1007014, partial [Marasmius fiardii PR-910]